MCGVPCINKFRPTASILHLVFIRCYHMMTYMLTILYGYVLNRDATNDLNAVIAFQCFCYMEVFTKVIRLCHANTGKSLLLESWLVIS